MLVSNNSLLSILLPNENKVLKDVLKEADNKTLTSIKSGNTTVGDILKNLFNDLKNGDKSKANIENLLKNSNVFKDLGSFTKSVTTLLNQIDNEPKLLKFKPQLEAFLKDVSTLDNKSLKDLIAKSGVFLESKALEQLKSNTTLPKNLETILGQIKSIIKDIPSLETKKIENLIDKILQNNSKLSSSLTNTTTLNNSTATNNSSTSLQNNNDLKSLIGLLQNLSKNIGDKQIASLTLLTNSLKNISTQAQLVESKINNIPTNQPNAQTSVQANAQATVTQNIQPNTQTTVQPNAQATVTQNIQSNAQTNIQQNVQQIVQNNLSQNLSQVSGTQVKENINIQQALNQLKSEVLVNKNIPNTQVIIKQIDGLLQNTNLNPLNQANSETKNLLSQFLNSNEIKLASTQNSNISSLVENIKSQLGNINLNENKVLQNQATLAQVKESISTNTQQILSQLKSELLVNNSIQNTPVIIKQIDNLLQTNDLFSKNQSLIEPKNLITNLTNLNEIKNASTQNTNIASLVSNLKNHVETINTIENKILQNQNVQPEKIQITQDINQALNSLKSTLQTVSNIDTKAVNQIIDRLLNLQNLFTKIDTPIELKNIQQNILNQNTNLNNFQSNFSSNINNLIINLKESITNLVSNQNNLGLQQNIIKTVEKLEVIVNNFMQNSPQNADIAQKVLQQQNVLQNDMKTVLLQMQEELAGKTDVKNTDTVKQIDKMLMQIDYHQLLSIASNSNSVYIPFIWDMLDDGSISMKKLDEEKFYCEINLSLKEFGQTQLLLALYDKNKLDLTIYASKDSFKQSIRENSTKLKQALNAASLIPVNINIIDLKKEEEKPKEKQNEMYGQNINLGLGVDIKA